MHLFVDPTVEGGEDDTSEPVVATFGFVSDGLCYQTDYFDEDDPAFDRSDDVSFVWTAWTQLPDVDITSAVDARVWYRQFALSSRASDVIVDRLESSAGETSAVGDYPLFFVEEGYASSNTSADDDMDLMVATLDFDGLDEASSEIDLFVNDGLLVWDIQPDADPDTFYIPLAMLSSIVFKDGEPISTVVTPPTGDIVVNLPPDQDRYDSVNVTSEETLTAGVRVFLVEPDALSGTIQDSMIGPEVVMQGASDTYTCLTSHDAQEQLQYRWYIYHPAMGEQEGLLIAPVTGTTSSEPSGDTLPRMYRGYAEGAVDPTNDSDPGVALLESLGWEGTHPTGLVIHNIPVPGELLFSPDEPHIVELPYTFWFTIGPLPEDSGSTMPDTEPHQLRTVIAPTFGGSVRVTTPTGVEEPVGPSEGDADSVALDYFIDIEANVTLTAVPAEGYRFVAWSSEDFHVDIQDPHSSILTLHIVPPMVYSNNPRQTTVVAHFAPWDGEPPEDIFPESMMGATIKPVSETIESDSSCESTVTIDYEVVDLTGGQRLIDYAQLSVDGDELSEWFGAPTDRHQSGTLVESDCSRSLVITLTATNTGGQTMVATKVAPIPPLSTHFGYHFEDGPEGGDCKKQIVIDLQAVDLTVPDNPITHVVVKGNTSTWHDSGPISTALYEHSFSGLVTCGGTYDIAVTATDSDGNTHTYYDIVEVPDEEPPEEEDEEPPPPPPGMTTLYGAMAASADCTSSGPECSCQLSISFDGKDLTGGTYPVTSVVLKVNGQVWHDSGSISTTQYHQVVTKTVSCGASFSLELTVENSIGQTGSSTGSLTTPVP